MMEKQQAITQAIGQQFVQQVDFLQQLVQANSVNPFTPETSLPSVPVEEAIATIIQQELRTLGFKANQHNVSPQRSYVIDHLPGSGTTENTVILTTHMDAVAT